MENEPTKNERIARNSDALHSSEKQGSKPKNGSKIATIICAILAVAGLGFGVYGFFFKKPAAPTQNTDTTNLESELSSLKQKYSVLQNYVKELEASGTEISEEVKTATSAETTSLLYGVIKDTEAKHYILSAKLNAYVEGSAIAYEVEASASNGELNSCKVYKGTTGDREEVKDCDVSTHSGQIVDIIGGVMGNGLGSGYGIYIVTDQGELEFIDAVSDSLDNIGTLSKVDLPKKIIRAWGDSKLISVPFTENGEISRIGGGAEIMVQYVDGTLETIFNYMKD